MIEGNCYFCNAKNVEVFDKQILAPDGVEYRKSCRYCMLRSEYDGNNRIGIMLAGMFNALEQTLKKHNQSLKPTADYRVVA